MLPVVSRAVMRILWSDESSFPVWQSDGRVAGRTVLSDYTVQSLVERGSWCGAVFVF